MERQGGTAGEAPVLGWDEGFAGEGKPPKEGRNGGGERGRVSRRHVRREWGVSAARPHLVQLILEHFQLRQVQLGDVN